MGAQRGSSRFADCQRNLAAMLPSEQSWSVRRANPSLCRPSQRQGPSVGEGKSGCRLAPIRATVGERFAPGINIKYSARIIENPLGRSQNVRGPRMFQNSVLLARLPDGPRDRDKLFLHLNLYVE